jgi:hypothetical protein
MADDAQRRPEVFFRLGAGLDCFRDFGRLGLERLGDRERQFRLFQIGLCWARNVKWNDALGAPAAEGGRRGLLGF